MDNTTQQTNNQPQNQAPVDNQTLSPDALAATLAHATNLRESMMPQEAPQTPQNAPQQGEEPQEVQRTEDEKLTSFEGKMDNKIEILRTEMRDTIKNEIGSIRDEIKSALENEQD